MPIGFQVSCNAIEPQFAITLPSCGPLPERSGASTASGGAPMASITTPIIPNLGILDQNARLWCGLWISGLQAWPVMGHASTEGPPTPYPHPLYPRRARPLESPGPWAPYRGSLAWVRSPLSCGPLVATAKNQSSNSLLTDTFSPPARISIASSDGFALPRSIRLI